MRNVFGSVVNGIELAVFVREANLLEQRSDLGAGPHHLEVVLSDAQLRVCLGEQKVDGLRLVTIVAVISH